MEIPHAFAGRPDFRPVQLQVSAAAVRLVHIDLASARSQFPKAGAAQVALRPRMSRFAELVSRVEPRPVRPLARVHVAPPASEHSVQAGLVALGAMLNWSSEAPATPESRVQEPVRSERKLRTPVAQ
jgi:hypothetical protein